MTPPTLHARMAAHRDLEVRRLALSDCDHHTAPVVHDHAGIALVVGGTVTLHLGADYRLRDGDLLLVPEGAAHHMVDSDAASMIGLSVCTACLRERWGEVLGAALEEVRRGAPPVRRLEPAARIELEHTLERLAVELEGEAPARDLAVSSLMSWVAVAIQRASPARRALEGSACSPVVASALSIIEARALEGLSLRDVAAAIGRAPGHLATVVKRETGRTVGEWIAHARMAVARQLLVHSNETIETIAERVGYASPSHFHRTFRRWHDASPDRWRAHHRDRRVTTTAHGSRDPC